MNNFFESSIDELGTHQLKTNGLEYKFVKFLEETRLPHLKHRFNSVQRSDHLSIIYHKSHIFRFFINKNICKCDFCDIYWTNDYLNSIHFNNITPDCIDILSRTVYFFHECAVHGESY